LGFLKSSELVDEMSNYQRNNISPLSLPSDSFLCFCKGFRKLVLRQEVGVPCMGDQAITRRLYAQNDTGKMQTSVIVQRRSEPEALDCAATGEGNK
jgi:hypothetical protein